MTMTFFWCQFGFGKCFGASSWSSLWDDHCWLSYKIHFSSHITIWLRNGPLLLHKVRWHFTMMIFFFLISNQFMRPLLTEPFHLSKLLQMPNDYRMINVEFLGNFLFTCRRISFNDALGCCQLPMDGHCTPQLQDSHLLCKASWTTTMLYVH